MTTRQYKPAILILAAALAGAAGAPTASAEQGWYAGGALGRAHIDEDVDDVQLDADSTTFRVFGGFSFNANLAVEVSYLDLGTFEDTVDAAGTPVDVSADADGFSLAAVGRVPLTERLSLRGKAGVFFWDGQSTVNGITENDPGDQNAFVGAGIGYAIAERASLFFDVEYYDLDGVEPLLATAGFAFRF